MSDSSAEFTEMLDALYQSEQMVALAFESAGRKRIEAATVATFHCAAKRSCIVLTVWRTPAGLMFYRPRYRLSPALNNAESNAEGRANNTEDGDRRWLPSAGNLDQLRGWGDSAGMPMNCDHLHKTVMVPDLFPVVDSGRPGHPSRHVVS